MFGTGAWANDANGVTTTGLDDVDLWVGGLAEVTNLFGGLLGSTFNYVFQTQLEKLQDGDRLYYLARTPGMNLRTQLEGNSFSELIQRNTDGTNTLKADAFATADCKFQLAQPRPARAGAASRRSSAPTGRRRPDTTDCDENQLLLRKPDGTIQYRPINTVDPSGINGQSVYNGTAGDDRVFGGNDNDTFWGGDGNDVIEGNGGDDVALGGDGNDIITDLGGADVLKGGPGNDAIDGGLGDDISWAATARTSSTVAPTTTSRSPVPATTSSSPVRAPTPCSATVATTGSRVAPVRTCCRATTVRRSSTTRPRPLRATTSSSVRSARTTTTPRVATTSWRRTRPSTATPVPAASTGHSTSTTPSAPTTT